MGDRQIRHVEDLFGAGNHGNPKPQNMLERKTSFNMFKNKPAPQPPSGKPALPKIGNYQPKILLEPKPTDTRENAHFDNTERLNNDVTSHRSSYNNGPSKPMVIGDKNELLHIEQGANEIEEHPVPAPRRKRQAPRAPNDRGSEIPEKISGNPLFGSSSSHRSDEERLTFEEQGGDIDFGPGIDNPAFVPRSRQESTSSYRNSYDHSKDDHLSNSRRNSEKMSLPYIPPPDYEDEEVTMDFEDETNAFMHDLARNNRNSRPISAHTDRVLEGEDYGRYLEDDYEFDAPNRRPHHPPPGHFGKQRAPRPPKQQQKFNKHQDNKKAAKSKKKHDKHEASMKRNTIRDFTFSDSKIGWGDRTVKSTSAKGRYIKREKDRIRIDKSDQFVVQNNAGPGSYEDFLRMKNGIPMESPNSSDSGVEMGEDKHNMDMYLNSQPKQFRHGKYDQKPSVWQRLTWRFRKNVTVTREEEYAYNTKL